MRILGLDPGLQRTGWGVIEQNGNHLRFTACGVVTSNPKDSLSQRLSTLFAGLNQVLAAYPPDTVAVEETFLNDNPRSTLKLGQARGVSLLVPALAGLEVFEYTPNAIKKAVVGAGHADKRQIQMMIKVLLGVEITAADAADALAIAVCHAHHYADKHRETKR
jgi:crossover junction endodeoxyribonuclease RuvC